MAEQYQYPREFSNLGEIADAPPVQERPITRQRSTLENLIGSSLSDSPRSSTSSIRKFGESGQRATHRRAPTRDETANLTENAAPEPVDRSPASEGALESRAAGATGEDSAAARRESLESASGKPRDTVPQWLTELYTVSYLIFFSFFGTLARLGVQWLTFYPGAPATTPVLWANFGGSLIMGFLSEDQALFRQTTHWEMLRDEEKLGIEISKAEVTKRKKTIPLFLGLTTGFCGCFTSFSSFARDAFLALANSLPSPIDHPYPPGTYLSDSTTVHRNGGYSFLALLGVIFETLALSIGALIVGAQLAAFLTNYTPAVSQAFSQKFLDRIMVLLAFGCWLGAVLLAIFPPDAATWRGEAVFALVFSPIGCLLRFYLSLKLNGIAPAFPLGTFAANMFGTAVLGMCYDIQHVRIGVMGQIGGGRLGCQVLEGVIDGFCGCLTTVSTWVSEINALKRKHGWLYALLTLVGGICLMIIIMGSVKWSVGYDSPMCLTGYTNKIHG